MSILDMSGARRQSRERFVDAIVCADLAGIRLLIGVSLTDVRFQIRRTRRHRIADLTSVFLLMLRSPWYSLCSSWEGRLCLP